MENKDIIQIAEISGNIGDVVKWRSKIVKILDRVEENAIREYVKVLEDEE